MIFSNIVFLIQKKRHSLEWRFLTILFQGTCNTEPVEVLF